MDAGDVAQIAHDFLHREGGGRGFGVDQQFATRAVHQLARDACGLLGLAFGIAEDEFDLPAEEAAGGVDAILLHQQRVARGGAEQGDRPGHDALHSDAQRIGLRLGHPRGGQQASCTTGQNSATSNVSAH